MTTATAPSIPRRPGAARARGAALAPILAITAVALALRLVAFRDALFGDELSTYYIVTGHGLGRTLDLLAGQTADLNPPLLFVLAWLTERLGDPSQSIRIASLVGGTAVVPLTWLLGVWTVGRRAAFVGAALTALSPFLIFYSSEARAYALVLCVVLLSTLALVRARDTGATRWWIAYAVASCAAMYAHYPAVFVLVAQLSWALATRPASWRPLLAANVAAAVGYVPWIPTLLDNTRSPGAHVIELLEPFGPHVVRVDLGRWAFGHPFIPIATLPGAAAVALLVAGLTLSAVGAALAARRAIADGVRPLRSEGLTLVVVLALATPVLIALYSSIGNSVWDTRNLISSWPGLALTIGALVTAGGPWLRVAAAACVIGAFAIGAVRTLDAGSQRPGYVEAASYIERSGGALDPVVEVPAPYPGPLTPLGDVALNRFGRSSAGRHAVLRLGVAPLGAALRAKAYATPPAPAPEAIARQAARLARGRTLFLVVPGSAPLSRLRAPLPLTVADAGLEPTFGDGPPAVLMTAALAPVRPFLAALPPRLRLVAQRSFSGLMPVSVYVFRASPA